jgi:hypothetical protein
MTAAAKWWWLWSCTVDHVHDTRIEKLGWPTKRPYLRHAPVAASTHTLLVHNIMFLQITLQEKPLLQDHPLIIHSSPFAWPVCPCGLRCKSAIWSSHSLYPRGPLSIDLDLSFPNSNVRNFRSRLRCNRIIVLASQQWTGDRSQRSNARSVMSLQADTQTVMEHVKS